MSAEQLAIPANRYTVEEFFDLIPDGQKADLIDGEIFMASPDSPRNDDIGLFLSSVMRLYAEEQNLGRVTGSRVAYVLSASRSPEPDIAFLSREREDRVLRTRVQ